MQLSIVGGGYAGLWAAMSAAAERHRLGIAADEIRINLISNSPDLVNRPRLYEGASGDMRTPLKPLLDVMDVGFEVAQVADIIPADNQIVLDEIESDRRLNYDRLILASGSRMRKLPFPGADQYGFSIDTYEETVVFDQHLAALVKGDDLCVVVVGASFTGIELVTELRHRLGQKVKLLLLDHATEVGRYLGRKLNPVILTALSDCAIDVRLNTRITALNAQQISLADGQTIETQAVVFATGLEASPLTQAFDVQKDRTGRLVVDQYLKLAEHDRVFVAGDTARAMADDHHATFMCCQHAIQLGRHAGHNAVRSLAGQPLRPYRQESYVTCLDLGPAGAVFTKGWNRQVETTGADGKVIKKRITHERIYPPRPEAGAASIFQTVTLEPESAAP